MSDSVVEADLLIVGAGPAGLYGAYYAGFRGWSVAVVDSLPELGGQVSALYPEKAILDVAGFPTVKGRELVEQLVEQAGSANPTYLLDRTATGLTIDHDDADPAAGGVTMELDDGTTVRAKVVVITAGIGKFTPRPLPAGDGWEGRGLVFFIPSFAEYAGRDVVIVGGGDSAFDWAEGLRHVAGSVTLVHRRDRFRAHQATVDSVLASDVEIITNAQVSGLVGDGVVEHVEITTQGGEVTTLPAQTVVAALGFVADLGAMQEWGLDLDHRHIRVDTAMRTNLPRVFAAGDITEYEGKVRLIAVGFGEVATAINNAAVVIDPEAHVFPGHSSEGS
ncbi:NAD(P)/FAD-dependent oxidoreductase [Nocardioides mangrovicus]|uniref:Ferredoxin--NADP reductase n=1 Tax=Nocardioides mangrovicus TaxID=2478913 RepID=A0A3L8P1H3_9ACTN|nr:NAD(P)/FAD-dependent oxidoreductase [Nocardioides mangrovicus]RLV49300.1 NAD(P)/FAD-dependent oxidoreductase [Nocardioides mangrovicus]